MVVPHVSRWRVRRFRLFGGLIAMVLALLLPPVAAMAHPLDVYLQSTYITVAPTTMEVELDLSPGILVAPAMLAELDTDGDQQISDAEGASYAAMILRAVAITVDGTPLALEVTKIEMPTYLVFQAGYATIRVWTSAALATGTSGTHQISYSNNNAPTGVAYMVNTFIENGASITLGKQNRDSIQQSINVDYTFGSATTSAANASSTTSNSLSGLAGNTVQAQQLAGYLSAGALTPWALLLALGVAVVLGGLHALTPGHGKTLVAAYLVGSRGTMRHAVALGAVVTFTHTASVIVIGLLALFASQYIVPTVLVPVLGVASGLLVVGLGARLIWERWNTLRGQRQSAAQSQAHDHAEMHDHGQAQSLMHDHGDGRVHTHLPPSRKLSVGGLLAMGVSGGLVPCPEALGIMVIAIGLNRIALGLGLIVSFSFGLAAVLIILGILLVRSRGLVERWGGVGGRLSRALPLASAVIVTVLGIGITWSAIATYLT